MKELITTIIKDALKNIIPLDGKPKEEVLNEQEISNLIEIPPSLNMGDYAFPCFILSNKLKQEPDKIALEIRSKIKKIPEGFKSIETSGAYVNFFINREKLAEKNIKEILDNRENFGRINLGKSKKVLVEHTSINPNASPHVGRIRNALIGDFVVQLLRFVNFKPEVHYYVNDVSKQIAILVLAGAEKLKFESLLKRYAKVSKKVEKSKKLEKKVFEILNKLEKRDKKTIAKFKKIVDTAVKGQKKILSEIGIKYDYFDYESKYLKNQQEILKKLEKTGNLFKDKEGRIVLNQKGTSVEKKMKSPVLVLTRADGTGLYPLRDLAYTIDKLKSSNYNIIILGEDQKLYFLQLREALKLLGYEAPVVVHYSFILLRTSTGLEKKGKSKKMSTRKGEGVLLEDFLKEATAKAKKEIVKRKTKGNAKDVAISAVKYAILKNHPNKSVLFNLKEALNFEGDTGPYILYSYARASSILRKAKAGEKLSAKFKIKSLHEKEIELAKKLSQFPIILNNVCKNLNPSIIANYSYQLAQIFNEFYHVCPVINPDNSNQQNFRLALVQAFRIVLKSSLNLLGIKEIEKM